MTRQAAPLTRHPAYQSGGIVLFLAIGALLAALAFQYVGGFEPCPLCYQQRYAYFVGIPMSFAALVAVAAERWSVAAALFFLVAMAFLANAGLGVFHSGVEWRLWPGPDTCAAPVGPLSTGGGGLLKQLETTRVVRCDEAPWRLLGLSFAGWNAVISLLVMVGALQAAFAASASREPGIRPI